MKERPILMSAPMVRALLAGTKTQTRRVVKPQPPADKPRSAWFEPGVMGWAPPQVPAGDWHRVRCPYGQPGGRLWVRESTAEDCIGSASFARYTADGFTSQLAWWYSRKSCPSIHMPRWASRILLEIVDVRVERLQDISDADVVAEGIATAPAGEYGIAAYRSLWNDINGPGSWAANPWVWCVSFLRIDCA